MTKMPESNPKDNKREAPAGGQASPVGDTHLGSAMSHLKDQHPHSYADARLTPMQHASHKHMKEI